MKKNLILAVIFIAQTLTISAADFRGSFDNKLIPNTADDKKVIFEHFSRNPLRTDIEFDDSTHKTSARLVNPSASSAVKSMLIEEEEEPPYLLVDLNNDNQVSLDEKFVLKKALDDNPFLWEATIDLPIKKSFFTVCQIYVRYFKSVKYKKMTDKDRLVTQTTETYARGSVDINGKKVLVQYAYDFTNRKIDPQRGWTGIDANEDGKIEIADFSPETARANNEKLVLRVGNTYVSTKKANVKKNQIILREHKAKDYKRIELDIGKVMPDFAFTTLSGKKRSFSEFRGKYILLDFWGLWCPPCLKEMPYLREAHNKFKDRNFDIVGMNTDRQYTLDSIIRTLSKNKINWVQARRDSFEEFMDYGLRVESFPATFLISPEGKILSMNRTTKGEPDLRGKDLLETLDKILPE